MLPAVEFHVVRGHVAVHVGGGPGGGANAIGVKARIEFTGIFYVKFMNLGIQPVNFVQLDFS